MNTIETLSQNLSLLLFALIAGSLQVIPNIFLAKKNKWFIFAIPGLIFVPSFVYFLIGLGDTAWSVFPKVLIGALGICFALGGSISSLFLLIKKPVE